MILFFGRKACRILAPWSGIEPAHPAQEASLNQTASEVSKFQFHNC